MPYYSYNEKYNKKAIKKISHKKNNYDLINLHWIQGEMISIEEIGRIKKPIVWTLHDAWPFCGTEHFPNGLNDKRYEYGYFRSN